MVCWALQALVVEAGTWHLPMQSQLHEVHLNFQKDMPKLVSYARWDIDDKGITSLLKDRMLTRFSATMPGDPIRVNSKKK